MNNLPTSSPAEVLAIAPESLEVANSFLQHQSIAKVSEELGIPTNIISMELSKREVRAYIDNVFLDIGFNNRFRMRQLMDTLITQKLSELEEAGIGSNKDIAELLALSHKMTMEQLDRQIKLEELRNKNINNQVNVQVNDFGSNTKYGNLIQKLLQPTND